jgi:hypothetical protein
MMLEFKHNLNEFAKDFLNSFLNSISQSKKKLHQQAADIIKEDIKENYDEEFQKVVDPNSTWQQLKESLGFPSRPGHFTGSTLNALVAEATEEIGQVMLKGKWPSVMDKLIGDNFEITPFGIKVKSFKDETKGLRIGSFVIPIEDFESKQYGSWIGEDIQFMRLRPDAEKKVIEDITISLEREMQRVISNFQKGNK